VRSGLIQAIGAIRQASPGSQEGHQPRESPDVVPVEDRRVQVPPPAAPAGPSHVTPVAKREEGQLRSGQHRGVIQEETLAGEKSVPQSPGRPGASRRRRTLWGRAAARRTSPARQGSAAGPPRRRPPARQQRSHRPWRSGPGRRASRAPALVATAGSRPGSARGRARCRPPRPARGGRRGDPGAPDRPETRTAAKNWRRREAGQDREVEAAASRPSTRRWPKGRGGRPAAQGTAKWKSWRRRTPTWRDRPRPW
jgi:hypothetical protein